MERCCNNCVFKTCFGILEMYGPSKEFLICNFDKCDEVTLPDSVCEFHSYHEEKKTYVLYDEKYLGPGYFIINQYNEVITSYAKFHVSNYGKSPHYYVQAYEKDGARGEYKTINFYVDKGNELYKAIEKLHFGLRFKSIETIDSDNQKKAYFTARASAGTEDPTGYLNFYNGLEEVTDFVNINIGDNTSCKYWDQFNEFYNDLSYIAIRETNENDISKILKMTI